MADFNARLVDPLPVRVTPEPALMNDALYARLVLPPANAVAPVIGNFTPSLGTEITGTTPLQFDVTDDEGLFRRVMVVAYFPRTGVQEVVHDGDTFVGHYATTSTRLLIANGFRFTVLRSTGWSSSPTIRIWAVDEVGNEASST